MYRFKVTGMNCGHCASSIEKAIKSVDPKAKVTTDIATAEISVLSQSNEVRISDAIREAGYDNQNLAG